jgi:hypothetical protein
VPRAAVRQGSSGASHTGSTFSYERKVSSYISELAARTAIQGAFYDRLHSAIQEAYSINVLAVDALHKRAKGQIETEGEGLDEASLQAAREAIRMGFHEGFASLRDFLSRVEGTMRRITATAARLKKPAAPKRP